jgi:methylmalonyl-CoA mutase, C-terminal domain
MQRRIRVLVGKPGLDGHDRGAKVVAAALRDAGMEVIYTGLHQTPQQIVEAALQEDVDVVALSILSGAHMTLFPEVLELMRSQGVGALLTGGGIVPPDDMETLAKMGVGRLFGPGSSTQDIVVYIRGWFAEQHGADALTPLPPPRPVETTFGSGAVSAMARDGAARDAAARAGGSRGKPRPGARPSERTRPAASATTSRDAKARRSPSSRASGRSKPGRAAARSGASRAPARGTSTSRARSAPSAARARAQSAPRAVSRTRRAKPARARTAPARASRRTGARAGRAR